MHGRSMFDKWIVVERPVYFEVAEVFINIKPRGKERPRDNWHTPEKTREWEDLVASIAATDVMGERPAINFPVAARLLFGLHKNRADTDNLEKIVWDALQKGDSQGRGKVITDDKFIRGYVEKAEHEVPKGEEFVWVRLYARRREDYANYMSQLDALEVPPDAGF